MEEEAEGVSLKLGFPLPSSPGDATKVLTSLSTILVASIQDAKDRISQIEYVFCSQFYPHFKSDAASKLCRIDHLQDLLRSKDSTLSNREAENAALLARIDELDDKLRIRTREFEEAEMKRVEEEGKLLERVEALACELRHEIAKRNRVTEAYKRLKSQHLYLRRKLGLGQENAVRETTASELGVQQTPIVQPGLAFENPNMTMDASDSDTAEVRNEIPDEDFGGLEEKTPDVFVAMCDENGVKEKASEIDRGGNLTSLSSGFCDVPKCSSSTKLVSVSSTKRSSSSWRQTRSHQRRAGPDPHDDFLDTPLENIRENLNKDCHKEDLPNLIQKDISMNSSDDETQDMNAKISPQKRQKQSSITVGDKKGFKYVEPVRKKAERENLKGVECKQCRKFYDAVLPNADGKDADSSKQNFRCEHLDGVSRHRYRGWDEEVTSLLKIIP